jgi:hypothetical protein
VQLTADLRSSSPNEGDIPKTKWTATGGTFVEDNKITVRWIAPASPGLYNVSVTASNMAGSAKGNTNLTVNVTAQLVTTQAGQVTLQANGTDFYYLRSPDPTLGVEAYVYAGAPADAAAPMSANGFELVYAPNLNYEVHATTLPPESLGIVANPRPRQIYMGNFGLATTQRISVDLAPSESTRKNQYAYPTVSPDAQIIAFQGTVTDLFAASSDSVDIFIYWPAGPTRVRATQNHVNHKNFYPTFSTDQNWLTFISDRSGANQWEVYGMPVSGTTVDTDPGAVVRLTNTGGTIAGTRSGGLPVLPLRAWDPSASTMAIVTADNTLSLMTTTGSGAMLVEVPGVPVSIQELDWSRTGSLLAVVATTKVNEKSVMQVYTVAGSNAQLVYQTISGDIVRDVAFSPDNQWMVFRLTRAGLSWLELLDLSGGMMAGTVPISGTSPAGNAAIYRAYMSLSPAWGTGDVLYSPTFGTGTTPGIMSLDVSGVIQ